MKNYDRIIVAMPDMGEYDINWDEYLMYKVAGNYDYIEFRMGDKFHRLDGPAREWHNGNKEWWVNGKLHRLDGPAIEWASGFRKWCVNDVRYTERDYPGAVARYRWEHEKD